MDLINLYEATNNYQSNQIIIRVKNLLLSNNEIQISKIITESNKLLIFLNLKKIQDYKVWQKITVDMNKRVLTIITSLIKHEKIFQFNCKENRLIFNRFSLKSNSNPKQLQTRINPKSGEMVFIKSVPISVDLNIQQGICQLIIHILEKINDNFLNLNNLKYFLNINQENCEEDVSLYNQIFLIITSVQSSNKYTWNSITQPEFVISKLAYNHKQKIHKKKVSSKEYLKNIFCKDLKIFEEFKIKSIREEEQLRKTLNQKNSKNLIEKIVNKIHIENVSEILAQRKDKFQVKVKTGDSFLLLQFQNMKKRANALKHQKKILEQIKDNSCLGIPKYYESQIKQLQNYRITNLINSEYCFSYVENNKQSMSLGTKICILGQISTVLWFLKNSGIVFVNLQIQNIKIKKKLMVKIINFQRSYNANVTQLQGQIDRKNLNSPTLLQVDKNRFKSQKYDAFSLCILIYYLLFNQFPVHVLQSNRQKYKHIMTNNYHHKATIGIQKFSTYGHQILMKVIGYFLIRSIQIKQKQQWKQSIPFIDWIFIILTQSMNFLSKITQ